MQNAGQSAQSATIQEALSGFTAADAVLGSSPVVSEGSTLRELADVAVMASLSGRWTNF